MTTITVHTMPIGQPRPRFTTIGGHARAYTPLSDPVHTFKAAVQIEWHDATAEPPLSGPVSVHMVFLMPRPKIRRRKKDPRGRIPCTVKPDIDNLVKAALDALSGLAFCDDKQVYNLAAIKHEVAVDEQPHVRITITGE